MKNTPKDPEKIREEWTKHEAYYAGFKGLEELARERNEETPRAANYAIRTQVDGLNNYYSDLSGIDTGPDTPTRQEFKDEADINYILRNYGALPTQKTDWGAHDYTLDLQQAIHAMEEASAAATMVPDELKSKYPTLMHVMNGTQNGEYEKDLYALSQRKKAADERAQQEHEFQKWKTEGAPKAGAQKTDTQ